MEISNLERQLYAFDQWKKLINRTVGEYRGWLEKYKLSSPDSYRRIEECLDTLKEARLTIAFVAEFSRGKTELINAIFFAHYGRRLLPSTAGRTTMCPTEMYYDSSDQAYVRLLPIETRLLDTSLRELKEDIDRWDNYPLDLNSIDQMENCMREVVQTRKVNLEEAVRLGLYDPDHYPEMSAPPTFVEIPKWRHALISFPHPLLEKGLTILDTPGLNALGSEPELTLNLLPSAQAVLFVLAADTGVTRTDLEIWQNHIKGFQNSRKRGLMVVLNKVDTLWDDLKEPAAINQIIENQCLSTGALLGINRKAVFPVSAQKGLLARIKDDPELLDRSALPHLENYLTDDILNARQDIIRDTITAELSHMVEGTRSVVANKLKVIRKQHDEFRSLSSKSRDVIEHLMAKTRREQTEYMRNVKSFQACRKILNEQAKALREALDTKRLEQTIGETHKKMAGNWTTTGLKFNMRSLFDTMRDNMQIVVVQSERARKLIRSIYRRFQNDHGFSVVQPKMFSIMRYRVELELLHQEAEIFRKNPITALTAKQFVIERFVRTMATRAEDIFAQARKEVDNWLKTALEPLAFQIKDHKLHMVQKLNDLQKVSHSRDTLESRIAELNRQHNAIAEQLKILRNINNTLENSQPLSAKEWLRPQLVTNRAAP